MLIDIRHEPQKIDIDFIENLAEHEIPFALIFTKSDKLSSRKLKVNLKSYTNYLSENWEELPSLFVTSSETGLGTEEVLDYIEKANIVFVPESN